MAKYINPETDGQFYKTNDMVKANCHDCVGCFSCCKDMGTSIVLDPYDIYQLEVYQNMTLEELLGKQILALTVKDHLIVPYIKMSEETNQCSFLNEEGRCTIHSYRPGICRLFPLGRDFQENELTYILLKDACPNKNRTKVKVGKWIGIHESKSYQNFVKEWHDFRKEMGELLSEASEEEAAAMGSYLLKLFYMTPFAEEDFYEGFEKRVAKIRNLFL